MDIAQPNGGVVNDFTIDRKLKMSRLFQGRVLRADGDDKFSRGVAGHFTLFPVQLPA